MVDVEGPKAPVTIDGLTHRIKYLQTQLDFFTNVRAEARRLLDDWEVKTGRPVTEREEKDAVLSCVHAVSLKVIPGIRDRLPEIDKLLQKDEDEMLGEDGR